MMCFIPHTKEACSYFLKAAQARCKVIHTTDTILHRVKIFIVKFNKGAGLNKRETLRTYQ